MNPEPLTKEKIMKMKDPYGHFNIEMLKEMKEKIVLAKDVKSAVEWLLKEIEKEIERIEINKSNAPWDYKVANLFSPESEGFVKGLKFAKVIIKEAFEGVIE